MCELALNNNYETIDPRSKYVKTRIPVVLINDSMYYFNQNKIDRYTEVFFENFKLLDYSVLKVNLTIFFF